MDLNNRTPQEIEIDLGKFARLLLNRKYIFIPVFILIFSIGFFRAMQAPKVYRVSMMI